MGAIDRRRWREKLTGGLIPAVPVPFTADGDIDERAQESYVSYMKARRQIGVAVWVHTGRGLYLSREQRGRVLSSWREGLGPDKLVVAGVGALPREDLPFEERQDAFLRDSMSMGEQAAELGADAFLVYAPLIYRGHPSQDRLIADYHRKIASIGLPIILFYLYEAAGGISYSPELLSELMSIPEVIGIKVATLDSVMTYQDIAKLIRENFPDVLLITGEDRMLGYTIMRGAKAALVGMGAACTDMQSELISAYLGGDYPRFHELSEKVDRFAEVTFFRPMEKYIVRMLAALMLLGVIPKGAVNDIRGYKIEAWEVELIERVMREIGEL